MAGIEGTIHTPIGTVQKKTALMVGGAVVVIGGIVWYRQKKLAASTPSTTDAEIDPATGYPYGSPEDAAALAGQDSYVSPTTGGGGGSSTIPTSNVGYTSNGQWTQAVIATLTNSGSISDPTQLSEALGKYVTGAYVEAGSAYDTLIQQAISVEGYPPVSGSNGYPPSINRTPPTSGGTTPSQYVTISNLHVSKVERNALTFAWTWGSVIPDYTLYYKNNAPIANAGSSPTFRMAGLSPNTTYKFTVRGVKGTTIGSSYSVSGKTSK